MFYVHSKKKQFQCDVKIDVISLEFQFRHYKTANKLWCIDIYQQNFDDSE